LNREGFVHFPVVDVFELHLRLTKALGMDTATEPHHLWRHTSVQTLMSFIRGLTPSSGGLPRDISTQAAAASQIPEALLIVTTPSL
jgi:hypothetical protein